MWRPMYCNGSAYQTFRRSFVETYTKKPYSREDAARGARSSSSSSPLTLLSFVGVYERINCKIRVLFVPSTWEILWKLTFHALNELCSNSIGILDSAARFSRNSVYFRSSFRFFHQPQSRHVDLILRETKRVDENQRRHAITLDVLSSFFATKRRVGFWPEFADCRAHPRLKLHYSRRRPSGPVLYIQNSCRRKL